MALLTCARCGEQRDGLERAPMPGAWGAAVHAETCAACWQAWVEEQTRIINHEGLSPHLPDHRRRLYRHLHTYLRLRGIEPPA